MFLLDILYPMLDRMMTSLRLSHLINHRCVCSLKSLLASGFDPNTPNEKGDAGILVAAVRRGRFNLNLRQMIFYIRGFI